MGKGKRLRAERQAEAEAQAKLPKVAVEEKLEPTISQMKALGMQEFDVAERQDPNRSQRRYFQKLMKRGKK